VIPTNARAVAFGLALQAPAQNGAALPAAVFSSAVAVKQQVAGSLMRRNPAFFGVGVGQSLDNPKEAALVIYVDRKNLPAQLPAPKAALRTRYIINGPAPRHPLLRGADAVKASLHGAPVGRSASRFQICSIWSDPEPEAELIRLI